MCKAKHWTGHAVGSANGRTVATVMPQFRRSITVPEPEPLTQLERHSSIRLEPRVRRNR